MDITIDPEQRMYWLPPQKWNFRLHFMNKLNFVGTRVQCSYNEVITEISVWRMI